MPAACRTATNAARQLASVPYSRSNSASVSPRMIARIALIPCSSGASLHHSLQSTRAGRLADERVVNPDDGFTSDVIRESNRFVGRADLIGDRIAALNAPQGLIAL